MRENVNILGINIDNVTIEEAVNKIENFIERKRIAYILTPNVDRLMISYKNQQLKEIYKNANLLIADGMPILWAAKFFKMPLKERVTGADLFPKLCEHSANKGYKLFLLGGQPGVVEKATKNLILNYPEIQIVGNYSPPFGFEKDEVEKSKIIETIKKAKPDILLIGLGAPKEESFICKYRKELKIPVTIGVGISFDYIAGTKKRAPKLMQRAGLEWLWRLIHEPRRLWKRYLIRDMKFFYLILREKIKLIKSKQKTQC